MAKIKFGAIVTDIRGSIDSVTYSRSRYGAYARKKVTPVNPNTVAQSLARAAFGSVSSSWRSLSQAARDLWNAVAPEYQRSNVFGDNLPLSGATLRTKLQTQLVAAGVTTEAEPIPPIDVPAADTGAVTADISSGTITVAAVQATDANTRVLFYGSAPVSAGKSFFARGQMRLLGNKPESTAAGDFDLTSAYEDTFGDILQAQYEGLKIRVQVKLVNLTNGQPGPIKNIDAVIQA